MCFENVIATLKPKGGHKAAQGRGRHVGQLAGAGCSACVWWGGGGTECDIEGNCADFWHTSQTHTGLQQAVCTTQFKCAWG